MQIRLNSGGIDYIMVENTIENGELYPNNGNISTKSGNISQHNKKHNLSCIALSVFFPATTQEYKPTTTATPIKANPILIICFTFFLFSF